MNVYLFSFTVRAMLMSDINIRNYDKLSLFPMCGYEVSKTRSSSDLNVPLTPKSPHQPYTISEYDETNYTNTDTTKDEDEERTDMPDEEDKDLLQGDHIDLGIGVELDKFYILTYLSPDTINGKSDSRGDDTTTVTDTSTDITTRGNIFSSSKTTRTTSFKRTVPTTVFFTPEKPASRKTTVRRSLFRKRSAALTIPSRGSKDSSEKTPCSCTITTANTFSMHILHVGGHRPNKTRLVIDAGHSATKQHNNSPFKLDVANFWKSDYNSYINWNQSEKTANVTITIDELVKPRFPYMVMLGVSGSNDLKIDCMTKSKLWGDIRGHKKTQSTMDPKTQSTIDPISETPVGPKEVKSTDQGIDGFRNPWFIGAITVFVIGLLFMIIGLTLWKRSHANFRKAHEINQKNQLITAHRYTKNDETVYEEMPGDNRSRSGSKTKLGTMSLSMRGQHSPVLNQLDRKKKDSLDRKAILTTIPHSPANAYSTNNNLTTGSNALPTSKCDIYEELPDVMEHKEGECAPPPKPFLDRESLMIQRSQSTPIHYSTGSDSEEESEPRGENRRKKSSQSYSEDRSARIDRNLGELLLKKEDYIRHSVPTQGVPDPSRSEVRWEENQSASSSESHSGDDSGGDDEDGDEECDCEGNDPDSTYVDIDFVHRHSDEPKIKTNALQHNNDIPPNTDTNRIVPEMKATTVWSEAHDEELVMFDNIVYQTSSAVQVGV